MFLGSQKYDDRTGTDSEVSVSSIIDTRGIISRHLILQWNSLLTQNIGRSQQKHIFFK